MSYFAQVVDGSVVNVIRIEQEVLNSGAWGDPASFVQTSYNTHGGIHYEPNTNPPVPSPDQSKALRANYAGVGYIYDSVNDVFYTKQPYPSWTISAPTWIWEAPVPYPSEGGPYMWDEATQSWVPVPTISIGVNE